MHAPSRWLLAITWSVCTVIWLQHLFTIGVFYYVQPWIIKEVEPQLAVLAILGLCILTTLSVYFSRTAAVAVAWVLGAQVFMVLVGLIPTCKAQQALELGREIEWETRGSLYGTGIGLAVALVLQYLAGLLATVYSFCAIQLPRIVDRKAIRSRMAEIPEPPPQ